MPNKQRPEEHSYADIDMTHNRDLDRNPYRKSLDELEKAIEEMPYNMRSFSLCLRQLYVEKAVGTNEKAAVEFRKIRDKTKNDAIIYLENVLPLCTKLISSIDEFFDYVIEFDASTWHSSIQGIEETVGYCAELCKTVKHLHEDIISVLKEREEEVVCVMKKLHSLQETLNSKKESLEKRSKRKHDWAWKFVLGENSRMAVEMFTSSNKDLAKAIAHGAQAQTQQDAAKAVSKTLIPALKAFIDGLEKVTSFFAVLQKKGISNFEMDEQKAIKIKRYCHQFIRVIPSVKTDLQAIPTEGTDQNYIDRWLEKQRKSISASCTSKYANDIIATITRAIKPKPKALKNAPEPPSATPNPSPYKKSGHSRESEV